jgi:CubicO group peptidase (beta-lactamase class C family)
MTRKTPLLLFFILAFNSVVDAQKLDTVKLDTFFTRLAIHNKGMGSAAISSNGVILYKGAVGCSQNSLDVRVASSVNTKYRIGSITKMFTAVMIFQLIEEGKLSLDSKLSTYFVDMPNADKITVGQMLSHRSGLHNFTSDSLYTTYKGYPQAEEDLIAVFENQPSDFEPDSKADYSNTNYVLLGYIIEKITKKNYQQELKERITDKIGLSDTYCGREANIVDNEAYSFVFTNKWEQQPETNMTIPEGAGSIVSTATDLCKFIEALFDDKLISKNSLEKMKTIRDNFGMGMFVMPFFDKKGYGHAGDIDAFSSMLVYFPDDKVAACYLSNGEVYPINDIMIAMLSIYFNRPFELPTFKTLALSTDDLDKYLGDYASKQMPLKITVTKNGTMLYAQGTDQPQFMLEAVEQDKFVYAAANITMQFNPVKGECTVIQGGKSYLFTKVKE